MNDLKCDLCGDDAPTNEDYNCEQYLVTMENTGDHPQEFILCQKHYQQIEHIIYSQRRHKNLNL